MGRCADFELGRNQTVEDIRVMVRGDRVVEDDEDFLVRLTATGGTVVQNEFRVRILDDDQER